MIAVYRVPLSTNVERVALALGHKGLEARWIDVPPGDRSAVRRVSGQDLVPILDDGGRVVVDSMEIVRYLEEAYPDTPGLYPRDPARRADCLLFIDWFNRVWKRPPNEIEAEWRKPAHEQDQRRIGRLGKAMQGYLDLFEQMLTGRDCLQGEFSAADVAAFPFVKYAAGLRDPKDDERFHLILEKYQRPGTDHPRVLRWIASVDTRPRG